MTFRSVVLKGLVLAACLIAAVVATPTPGRAQTAGPLISPPDLAIHPDSFLGKANDWKSGFCFTDEQDYVCVGADTPFEVVAPRLASPGVEASLKRDCGGLDAVERNPSPDCAYRLRFVARSFERFVGDYFLHRQLKSDVRLVRFRTEAIEVPRK
jgi:hypothetical protein